MAWEYSVLDRVFYGSDYVGGNIEEYVSLLKYEIGWIKEKLNPNMEKLGFPVLSQHEMEGLLGKNVLKLWNGASEHVQAWAMLESLGRTKWPWLDRIGVIQSKSNILVILYSI